MGDDEKAKKVLISENQEQARAVPLRVNRFGDWIWYRLIGPIIDYGYRPWRAFWISIVMILVGWVLFWRGLSKGLITPTEGDKAYVLVDGRHELSDFYPQFNSFIYSLETFVPLLKLGLSDYWLPNAKVGGPWGSCLRWYLWTHIIAGWFFTTLWLGGMAGLVKT
jgi:hypothetical protein